MTSAAVRTALAAVVAVPVLAATAPAHAGGSCAGTAEYDKIHDGQSLSTVQNIVGFSGGYHPGGPGTFGRKFRSCWAPNQIRVVVLFGNDTGLVERKRTEPID